jgi:hypothetical protein
MRMPNLEHDEPLRVDKNKLDITLTEIERGLKNEEAVALAKDALLLTQAELRSSGNWMKTDYNWKRVRESILGALRAIKVAQEYATKPPTKNPRGL